LAVTIGFRRGISDGMGRPPRLVGPLQLEA
jgi:hypothetical protein